MEAKDKNPPHGDDPDDSDEDDDDFEPNEAAEDDDEAGGDDARVEDLVEREAEESGSEAGRDSSEEEAHGPDTYVQDDFVVLGEEGEEAQGDEESRRKRKKLAPEEREKRYLLDEDDFNLIEENMGVKIARPAASRFKRLKKHQDEDGVVAEERQRLEQGLFGAGTGGAGGGADDDDDLPLELEAEAGAAGGGGGGRGDDEGGTAEEDAALLGLREGGDSDDDDMDDFIVREGAAAGRGGGRRREGGAGGAGAGAGVSSRGLRDAALIFGDGFGDFAARRPGLALASGEGEGEEDEGAEGEQLGGRRAWERRDRLAVYGRAYEPSLLAEHFVTAADEAVRARDVPERMQLAAREREQERGGGLGLGMGPGPGAGAAGEAWLLAQAEAETAREVEWLLLRVPSLALLLAQAEARDREAALRLAEALGARVAAVLELLHRQQLEVPFIATYRKEAWQPELSEATLWELLEWDERWARLAARRAALRAKLQQALAELQRDDLEPPQAESVAEAEVEVDPEQAATRRAQQAVARDCLALLDSAVREEDVQDLQDMLQLHLPPPAQTPTSVPSAGSGYGGGQAGTHKRPVRRSFYAVCQKAGLGQLAAQLGLSAAQFGQNLSENFPTHVPATAAEAPWELALRFVGPGFADGDTVLRAARLMAAAELAADARVRQAVRLVYMERAELSTWPTPRGAREIDAMHVFRGVKRLDGKPAKQLLQPPPGTPPEQEAQFLEVLKAEQAGLLTKRLQLPAREHEAMLREMEKLYLSDRHDERTRLWNEQRHLALQEALERHLYPLLARELEHRLAQEARARVAVRCAERLEELALTAGWRPPGAEAGGPSAHSEAGGGLRVVGCVWGGENAPSVFAALDADGALRDTLKLPFAAARGDERAPEAERRRRAEALHELRQFVLRHRPHLLALAASPGLDGGVEARRLHADLHGLAADLTPLWAAEADAEAEADADDEAEAEEAEGGGGGGAGTRKSRRARALAVTWVPAEVAGIFRVSERAVAELGAEMSPALRAAVAVGRYAQDPLQELAALFNAQEEALCLRLHPLQDQVPREQLLRALEQRMCRAVNLVGVDLNRALAQPRVCGAPLAFVCGLGPRKAAHLQQTLARAGRVRTREELAETGVGAGGPLGPRVFQNAAGFLRLRQRPLLEAGEDEDALEVLDETRVHPEDYGFARKMAADALDAGGGERDPARMQALLREVMRTPGRLDDIDLDSFADEWERQAGVRKRLTLYDIKAELARPFADPRRPWADPGARPDELFALLTGETDWTLQPGMLVTARVTRVTREGAQVRLEGSGLAGFVARDDLSDQAVERTDDKVRVNQLVHARVLAVNKADFALRLTCKNSELRDTRRWEASMRLSQWMQDPYLLADDDSPPPGSSTGSSTGSGSAGSNGSEEAARAKAAREREARTHKVRFPRVSAHPLFRNASSADAEAQLLTQGHELDFVVRPSNKAADHLTLTWRFQGPDVFVHMDVVEEGKTKPYELGRTLRLGREAFDDLDELAARYMEPLVQFAREVRGHRMFRDGPQEQIDAQLREEKTRTPARIPYLFGVSRAFPGRFVLSYLPAHHARHEFVTVTPQGLRFRSRLFATAEELVRWFKLHYHERA